MDRKQLDAMDPMLRHLFHDASEEEPINGTDSLDPTGQVIFEHVHGLSATARTAQTLSVDLYSEKTVAAERGATTALTIPEIEKALNTLREQLGARNPAFDNRFADLPKLLKAARIYCEETDFAREFLEAAVARDDQGMRSAVRKLVQENREELFN